MMSVSRPEVFSCGSCRFLLLLLISKGALQRRHMLKGDPRRTCERETPPLELYNLRSRLWERASLP